MTRTNTGILAGVRVLGADNVAEAVDMAGLDWTVETTAIAPTGLARLVDNVDLSAWKATYYRKPGTLESVTLGIVGKDYRVIQNAELLAPLNYLHSEFGAEFISAGTLKDGKVPFVQMRVPSLDRKIGNDDVQGFLLAKTSHDGSGALTIAATPTVLVCSNGMRGAFAGGRAKVSIRHTSNARIAVSLGADVIRQAERQMDAIEGWYEATGSRPMTRAQVNAAIAAFYGDHNDAGATMRQANSRLKASQTVYRMLRTTRGIEAPAYRSIFEVRDSIPAWDVFQAMTEADEWHRTVRGGGFNPDAVRAQRTLEGANDPRTAKIRAAVEEALVAA